MPLRDWFPPLPLSRAPMLAFALCLAGGIALSLQAGAGWGCASLFALIYALGATFFLLFSSRLPHGYVSLQWFPLFAGFAAAGIALGESNRPVEAAVLPEGMIAAGKVVETKFTPYGLRLLVEVDALHPYRKGGGETLSLRQRAIVYTDSACNAQRGDRLAFRAFFEAPRGEQGYVSYLKNRGIFLSARSPSTHIEIERTLSDRLTLSDRYNAWRTGYIERLRGSLSRLKCRGFLLALVSGDRSDLDPEVCDSFAAAGIAHVLAVSGVHVGFIILLVMPLLLPLNLIGGRRLRYFLSALAVWVFALQAGLGAPVVRSAVMATCMLAAAIAERRHMALNALGTAALLILTCDPMAVADAGFLLSFCVTGALVALMPKVPRRWSMLVLPVAAFLCSWMLAACCFSSIPLLFLPMNLLVAILLPLYFPLAMLHVALALCGWECAASAYLLEQGYSLMSWGAEAIKSIGAHREVNVTALQAALYMSGGFLALCWLHTRGRGYAFVASGCLALCALSLAGLAAF